MVGGWFVKMAENDPSIKHILEYIARTYIIESPADLLVPKAKFITDKSPCVQYFKDFYARGRNEFNEMVQAKSTRVYLVKIDNDEDSYVLCYQYFTETKVPRPLSGAFQKEVLMRRTNYQPGHAVMFPNTVKMVDLELIVRNYASLTGIVVSDSFYDKLT